jgi:hypothetical protein
MQIIVTVHSSKSLFAGMETGMEYSSKTNQELEQLIEQKDMDAACEMAQRCLEGSHGVEQNLNRAYQLFHRGESQGNRHAYEGLAYMYENGILFAQNLELARDYYTKAGIYKTDYAQEQVRVTNEERVAAAIAKAEAPTTVMVDKFGNSSIPSAAPSQAVSPAAPIPQAAPVSQAQPSASAVTGAPKVPIPPIYAASPTPSAAPVQPQAASQPAASAQSSEMAALAVRAAKEAAQAAGIAAQKAQEAARAAQEAAEYAQRIGC